MRRNVRPSVRVRDCMVTRAHCAYMVFIFKKENQSKGGGKSGYELREFDSELFNLVSLSAHKYQDSYTNTKQATKYIEHQINAIFSTNYHFVPADLDKSSFPSFALVRCHSVGWEPFR